MLKCLWSFFLCKSIYYLKDNYKYNIFLKKKSLIDFNNAIKYILYFM